MLNVEADSVVRRSSKNEVNALCLWIVLPAEGGEKIHLVFSEEGGEGIGAFGGIHEGLYLGVSEKPGKKEGAAH